MIGDTLTYKVPARKRHDRGNGDTVPEQVLDLVVYEEKNGYTRCREVGADAKDAKVITFQTNTFRALRKVGTELKANMELSAENAELKARLAALEGGSTDAAGVDPSAITVGTDNEETPAKKAPAKAKAKGKASAPAA